jgi:hypothetical protein
LVNPEGIKAENKAWNDEQITLLRSGIVELRAVKAAQGVGFRDLDQALADSSRRTGVAITPRHERMPIDALIDEAEADISRRVQQSNEPAPPRWEWLAVALVPPLAGLPAAVLMLWASVAVLRWVARGLQPRS